MRVIAGEAKGRPLKGPKTGTVRPTTERVREALFSILEAMDIEWGRVLDLFAGSGALGIEALSRGGEWAAFVEEKNGPILGREDVGAVPQSRKIWRKQDWHIEPTSTT